MRQEFIGAFRKELEDGIVGRTLRESRTCRLRRGGCGSRGGLGGAGGCGLLDIRLDEGVIGVEAAEQRLREWWATRG